jgi:hypothetical protein
MGNPARSLQIISVFLNYRPTSIPEQLTIDNFVDFIVKERPDFSLFCFFLYDLPLFFYLFIGSFSKQCPLNGSPLFFRFDACFTFFT